MTKNFRIFAFAFLLALSGLTFTQDAQAAILYALPEKRAILPGESISVDIKVNTEDVSINAAQATVQFPSNILELVDFDNSVSAFNFWVQGPLISNEDGTFKFIGGTPNGVSGQTLQVIKMTFKAVGQGTAQISINDAVVTANDGRGTNVLSTIEGTSIQVSAEVVAPTAPVIPVSPARPPAPAEQPERIVRTPVAAVGLPIQPKLRIPLYPDESRWYNHLGETIVFWDVPADVNGVATAIDKDPNTSPERIETELFTGKSFGVLKEGIWYIHVQFKNNVGWGKTAHYKISIDTTPPVPFKINIDQQVSDSPSPRISYETFDSLSGISKALIFVNHQEPIESQETSLTLPLQGPGKRTVRVRFLDKAGNSVEDSLEFEILPLQTPVIESLAKRVSRDEPVFVSGTGLPDTFIDLQISSKAGQAAKETIKSDNLGKWATSIKEPLLIGKYTITATARDERGALSYPSAPQDFSVRPQTIVSFGQLDFGWLEIFIIIALIILSGAGFYGWYYLGIKRKREAYAIVIARDVEKMHNLLKDNLDKLENNIENLDKFVSPISKEIDSTMKTESLIFIKRMQETLDKIRKYVKKEVEEMK
ncbi:MAG: hypothetical protein HYT20_03180 [Candidatus Nealsonbacteria bacterium]|nr:hypothetical protein [Candidatus Nealsonbacteria bacterium]